MNASLKEIECPKFDSTKNYMDDLNKDEYIEKDGEKLPKLNGLRRLAHQNRGGVKMAGPIGHPQVIIGQNNRLAIATVQYEFYDGTIFAGTADASTLAHKKPYSSHLVALAESKAEARCLRRAFNISAVAAEEIGSAPVAGNTDGPIEDVQIQGIRKVGKRKGLETDNLILNAIKSDASSLSEMTSQEGREAMKALNKLRKK